MYERKEKFAEKRENLVTHSCSEVGGRLILVEMVVVKLEVAKGHGEDIKKRETVEKKN